MTSTLWFWESDSTDSLKTFSPSFHFQKFQYASTHSPFGQSDITKKNNPTKLRDILVLKIPIHLNALLLLNGLTASHIVFNEVRVVLSPALAEMEKGWSRCKIKCTLKTLSSNIFVLFAWCTLCGILLGQRGYSPEIKSSYLCPLTVLTILLLDWVLFLWRELKSWISAVNIYDRISLISW